MFIGAAAYAIVPRLFFIARAFEGFETPSRKTVMPRPRFTLRALLVAIGYERAHRRVWIVAFGATALSISCCGLLAFAVQWFSDPGWDHYASVEQLKADFDSVHVIPAANFFTKLGAAVGPLLKSRSVLAATRKGDRASLYLQDIYGEFWKVTPERLFATPTAPARWALQYELRNGVLTGRWEITVSATPSGWPAHANDEFSVVLDDRNRMK
ncbi:MAG TPA: hypothetical protein VG826_35065 [Pirellulales bacterium]|nr:hypothetical protein [Pirellulales bacterium]